MIAGKKRVELTLTTVLDRTTEYDIYKHYLGHDFELGEPCSSPFHDDRAPSLSIVLTRGGRLHFTDFGGDNASGKVIDFVRGFYPGRNYNEILQCIDRDMNLGICNNHILTTAIMNGGSGGRVMEHKERALIQAITRRFTSLELSYWAQYHLDKADLQLEPVVYAIDQLFVDKKRVHLPESELVFGYLYEEKYWKIYRPLAESRKEKWISNVPHTIMFGMKDLVPGKPVLMAKAHKDCKIFRKIMGNTCGFQSEGLTVISEENAQFLKENFSDVFMNCDPDPAGLKTLAHYQDRHGYKPVIVPSEHRRNPVIKDFADVAKYKGLDIVKEFIIKKIGLV